MGDGVPVQPDERVHGEVGGGSLPVLAGVSQAIVQFRVSSRVSSRAGLSWCTDLDGEKSLLVTGVWCQGGADCEDGGVRTAGVEGAGRHLLPVGDTGRRGVPQAEGEGGGGLA